MSTSCRFTSVVRTLAIALSATIGVTSAHAAPDLNQLDDRLAAVAYRLSLANADRCREPMVLTGLRLHDIATYSLDQRALAEATFHFGFGFGIESVVPSSAADRAGLRVGDVIVAVNGVATETFERQLVERVDTYRRVEAFLDHLDAALTRDSATIRVARGNSSVELLLKPDFGCGNRFTVVTSNSLNAWSDGLYVAVTPRMMEMAATDDELAFVIGHEMVHNMAGHNAGVRPGSDKPKVRDGRSKKAKEIEADESAVGLIMKAGYDPALAVTFFQRASRSRPFDLPFDHPGIRRRIELVRAAEERIRIENAVAASKVFAVRLVNVSLSPLT